MFPGGGGFRAYMESVGMLAPLLLAAGFGVIWAIVNWKKASTPAIIAVATCAILAVFSCAYPAMQIWIPQMLLRNAGPQGFERVIWIMRGLRLTESLCWGASVAALVVAAFLSRSAVYAKKEKARRDLDDDEDDVDDRPAKKKRNRDDDADDAVSDKPMKKKRARDDDED